MDDASRSASGAEDDETVAAPKDDTVAAPRDETVTMTGPVVRARVAGALGRSRGLQKTWMGGLSADPAKRVSFDDRGVEGRAPSGGLPAVEPVRHTDLESATDANETVVLGAPPVMLPNDDLSVSAHGSPSAHGLPPAHGLPSAVVPSAVAPSALRSTDGFAAFLPWVDASSPVTPRYGRVVAIVAVASVVLPLVLFVVLSVRSTRAPTSLTPPASASSESIGRVEILRRRSDAVTELAAPISDAPPSMTAPTNAPTAIASSAPAASPRAGSSHASKPAPKKKRTKRH